MTQEELGHAIGVQKSAVQKYEAGKITNLRASTIMKLSRTFNVYPWLFLYNDPDTEFRKLLEAAMTPDSTKDLALQAAEQLSKSGHMQDVLILMATIMDFNSRGFARIISYASDLRRIDEYRYGSGQGK